MEILKKEAYTEYENFCKKHPNTAFQQSINWTKVKTEWDSDIIVVRNEDKEIIGAMLVLIRKMGFKTYMYANRGPICDYSDKQTLKQLYQGVVSLSKKHKAFKFIMDPLVFSSDEESIKNFEEVGFTLDRTEDFHKPIQPKFSYMLRYLKGLSYEDLLAKMSVNTRYYLKFGYKRGVVCKSEGLLGLDDFYSIYSKTGSRQGFSIRPKSYFEKIINAYGDNCKLFVCYHEDDILCGGIGIYYGDTVSHVYGASVNVKRNLKATHILQAELMKWATEKNCSVYDMQGVAPTKEDDEALYRVYQFKSSFAGEVVEAAGEFYITFDKIYNSLINTAFAIRKKLK